MAHALRTSCLTCVALLVSIRPATSRTWNVYLDGSGDASTIQAGIDSAETADTVLVHPGTYSEKLAFRGRNIVVRSSAGPEQTIIDAAGLGGGIVVTFTSGESRQTILEGFTITHGSGGMWIINSEPSVVGNIITENSLAQNGGGIWCTATNFSTWSPLIRGNFVTSNRSSNLAGGIGTLQGMTPEILDNYIAGNEARDGDGGGIYYRSFDNGAVIRGNVVINNRAGDHGGGIYVGHVGDGVLEVEVSWNLVADNYAHGSEVTGNSGGGIWLWETNAWVHHNTIANNSGDGPNNAYGGGIVIERPGGPIIERNIIAFSVKGGGIWCGGGATPTIRDNLAWQNSGGDGVKDCPAWWQLDGNVIANPYFCDMANGDFRVASNSGALTHPAGPLGVYPIPGCAAVSVHPSTWGTLKSRYR